MVSHSGFSLSFRHSFLSLISIFLIAATPQAAAQNLVITGVVDGPLTGGVPKAIEVCVLNDVPDLSIYGLGSANNGGGSDGEEFTFPAGPASAGTFLYVASETDGFATFFGFAPTYTSGAAAINGDDAIELFMSGSVTDVFGDINVDGTGQPWDHVDGWAYRTDGTGPDGSTFVLANWTFSGPNALDGETSNAGAATPFPIGAYSACELPVPTPDVLLSEIVVTPTAGEFIEIYNPTAAAIDLTDVYLTDATFAGGGTFYYNIVTGANAGGGGFADFHARFPDGASIGPGEFQTVALTGSDDFEATYGVSPDYELFEDGAAADSVSDMREALPGSINNQGGLTNSGEVVILYAWDGTSDLVQDIDYALWGDAAEAVDKTGVEIDGPDADATGSFYLPDTATGLQDVIAAGSHASGNSFQRVDFAEGAETQAGGNGVSGSDETSEDLSATWAELGATPGAAPPAPATDWVINEIHADPAGSAAGDANGDGLRDSTEDEFVEIVNTSGASADISGWTLSDGFGVRHTFPAGSVVPDGCSIVVFGGGTPTGNFGISPVQVASTGALGLNNGGDNVTLNNGVADVASAGYGSEGGDNQSLTRDPDISGNFTRHSEAAASGGALFSPGTQLDGSQFAGCPSAWVINEIHADPASDISGDANGDGVRDSGDDEFVEIVNRTGDDVDISGWTLADGFSVRHTFPANTVVYDGCSVVVFGGGTPAGAFGNSLVQTASGGSLGLNNGGDNITLANGATTVNVVGYGSDGGDNQSLTLEPDVTGTPPYVRHSLAAGSGGALYSPGTRVDGSPFDGCPVDASVSAIQGAGAESPLAGSRVITTGVVTALAPDGFFIQTAGDGDPQTSDAVFVFTGSTPTVAIGDEVEVNGVVVEFFGFTEISGAPIITVTGSGTLPDAIVFDADTPSPDPLAPSCAIGLECFEGMLVEIPAGIVAASNQEFGSDPFAEVHITAGSSRPFREPGIEFPGVGDPLIPTWDGNPEVLELDPDKLGLPNLNIPAGSTFSATGVIGFEFNHYEFWPSELTVQNAPLPVPVRAATRDEATIGSLNVFRLFDDVDDPPTFNVTGEARDDTVVSTDEYARRLAKLASYIVDVMRSPDILAVQEAEKLGVLQDLAAAINALDPGVDYSALLVEGNDVGTIDVGFLVKSGIKVKSVTQLGADELFTFDNPPSALHDRPPLLIDAILGEDLRVKVMVLHMRSLGGIETERVQRKRLEQALSVAQKIEEIQDAKRNVKLVVLGDFNAFEFTDGYVDVAGIIQGRFEPTASLVCSSAGCPDVVTQDLTNEVLNIDPSERYSFIFRDSFNADGSRGDAQILDQAMTSRKLSKFVTGLEFARGNADAAEELVEDDGTLDELSLRSSDHDGLVLYLCKDDDDCGDDDSDDDDSSEDDD
ncbi:MAG: lamin tail domain-containing protein [Woeseiaceae bacterium]|nr:lamin tail domain-containing protein [Woeseiaceae bacterium]